MSPTCSSGSPRARAASSRWAPTTSNAPVTSILVIGGNTELNIPLDSYSFYVQDDWRVNPRLTLNVGVRWDYVDGIPFDQERNPNFRLLQAAGQAGRFVGTALEDFGQIRAVTRTTCSRDLASCTTLTEPDVRS